MTVDWLSSFCSGAKVLIYSESFNLVQFSECLGCRLLTNYNFSKVTLNTIPVIIIILLGFRSVHNKKQQPRLASPWLKSLSCVATELAATTTNTEHTLQPAWARTAFTIAIGVPVPMMEANVCTDFTSLGLDNGHCCFLSLQTEQCRPRADLPDLRFIRVDFLAVPEVLLDEVPPATSTRRKLQVALVLHPLDAIERKVEV